MSEAEIKQFIEEHTKKLKPLYKEYTLSYWKATSSGKEEDYKRYEELQLEMENIHNNKEEFNKVKSWNNGYIQDQLIKRQIKILHNSYLSSQGDINLIKKIVNKSTEIEKKFNTFRARINGKDFTDNEIREILEKETDSEKLKEAWEASKKQGELVEKDLVELVKLRNQLAKSTGFNNFYERSLELNEQKPKEIISLFSELDKLVKKPFRKLKEEVDGILSKRYKTKELKPWHYQDLFFQEAPKIYKTDFDKYYSLDVVEKARKFYEDMGLDVSDILDKSDLYERLGKYQHAYCIDIDRKGDIRIMENVKNTEKWTETTLHELGHALYDKHIDKKLPFILIDTAHIFTTEAIAMLFGRQSKDIQFIRKYGDTEVKNPEKLEEEVKKMQRLQQLVFSRWAQVMLNFEKSLYENPEQDLRKLWWSLVSQYQLIDFSRDKPDWASKIHLVSSPVYYHNYMLGALLASQLNSFIAKNIAKTNIETLDYTNKKEIGQYLVDNVFNPGKKYEWNEMIKRATGEYLTAKYFAEEFCS